MGDDNDRPRRFQVQRMGGMKVVDEKTRGGWCVVATVADYATRPSSLDHAGSSILRRADRCAAQWCGQGVQPSRSSFFKKCLLKLCTCAFESIQPHWGFSVPPAGAPPVFGATAPAGAPGHARDTICVRMHSTLYTPSIFLTVSWGTGGGGTNCSCCFDDVQCLKEQNLCTGVNKIQAINAPLDLDSIPSPSLQMHLNCFFTFPTRWLRSCQKILLIKS